MENSPKNTIVDIEINKVPIHWDLNEGNLTFFGLDSALFWTTPSLSNMLAPIAEEIGIDLFRLLIAHSSSLGTEEDYHAMISSFATNFKDGFLAWGKAVSAAGWGTFEIVEYNPTTRQSTVIVKNSWELSTQKNLPPEKRWGAPFLQGKLIGLFTHAFQIPCWAVDTCYFDAETPYVEIKIFQSSLTIVNEINLLRHKHLQDKERELVKLVEQKTEELREAKLKIEKHSEILEKTVEERTANLLRLNIKLETEIKIRKSAEENLASLNQELMKLSLTDQLTRIANRRHFDEMLLREWNRAIRSKDPLSLIIADVDWFKNYNDTYGHQAGDHCLQSVAKLLNKCVNRSSDLLARYGGEEFAIILPMTDGEVACELVDKMILEFRNHKLPHSSSEYGYVTLSFGIVSTVPNEGETVESLFKAADDCLYSAKKSGRNKYVHLHYNAQHKQT